MAFERLGPSSSACHRLEQTNNRPQKCAVPLGYAEVHHLEGWHLFYISAARSAMRSMKGLLAILLPKKIRSVGRTCCIVLLLLHICEDEWLKKCHGLVPAPALECSHYCPWSLQMVSGIMTKASWCCSAPQKTQLAVFVDSSPQPCATALARTISLTRQDPWQPQILWDRNHSHRKGSVRHGCKETKRTVVSLPNSKDLHYKFLGLPELRLKDQNWTHPILEGTVLGLELYTHFMWDVNGLDMYHLSHSQGIADWEWWWLSASTASSTQSGGSLGSR